MGDTVKAKPKKSAAERFDVLAAEKGWTPEMLRKCGDCPKSPLPPGTKECRLPVEAMEDPFKDKPPQNAEIEYQNLHKNFYEKLRRILATNEMKAAGTPSNMPPSSPSTTPAQVKATDGDNAVQVPSGNTTTVRPGGVVVKVGGPNRNIKITATKNKVEADINQQ